MSPFILVSSVISTLLLVSPVLAQKQAVPPPSSSWGGIIPMMLLMFAIIYFLMIRPEQKKQKERQAMVNSIKKGDKVITIGGIMGVVQSVKDTSAMIRVADNTSIEFTKAAISTVIKDGNEKVEKTVEEVKDIKEKKK